MFSQADDSNIFLYFCIPNKLMKKVRVNKRLYINSLLTFFKEKKEDYIFVYEGKIVNCNSTFNDLKITENNILFAVENMKEETKNINVLNDSNSTNFQLRLKLLTNNQLKNECDRINDIRYFKMEGSRRLYRKKIHKIYMNEMKMNDEYEYEYQDIKYEYQSTTNPCTDPMPILW